MLALLALGASACTRPPDGEPRPTVAPAASQAAFVGGDACVSCHPVEANLWSWSHHDLAMQEATRATVLGDFEDATFNYAGVTSTFYTQNDQFYVRTDGPDGKLHDYPIKYTFGAKPLQQYLIPFANGRYQALSIAWDTRPAREGGQRWFHLYPNDQITFEDPLHWTGPYQNWNYMCAECHSTNLKKNYQPDLDSYDTSWSEIDVSCEACHGPGSRHVSWATAAGRDENPSPQDDLGLTIRLTDRGRGTWLINPETGKGIRSAPLPETSEIETCARCHSRRTSLSDDYVFDHPIGDTHRVSLLDEGLYHADGQIRDEVYVYGSYLQSKMYQAGVTCSDCHLPHSMSLRFAGDGVCARCHAAEMFETRAHHFHDPGTAGAACVDCHMPPKNYMIVDPRHDHSLRIPRPDLSLELGTPNACNGCHSKQTAQWALNKVKTWYGPDRRREPHYGEILQAGRSGAVGAEAALAGLLGRGEAPGIVRASAVELLAPYLSAASFPAVENALADEDSLVRRAAVQVLEAIEPRLRLRLLSPLLSDPVRTVRMQAARALASVPANLVVGNQLSALESGLAEYEKAQLFNADRAEGRLNLAGLLIQRGEVDEAEREYQRAQEMAPWLAATYVNLADLFRSQGRDSEGERLLRRGLDAAADTAELHHALGLLLVRQKRLAEALAEFEKAADQRPEWPRYAYVYGVALHSAGKTTNALEVLERAHEISPADREILLGLVTINRESGAVVPALRYARKLQRLTPGDASLVQLVAELERNAK